MNMVDFQEKMDPTHQMYLCRMLNVKELPEDLLERYAQVKRLVDRIDGHLTPGDLAMIIISLGANPEIVTSLLETTEGEDARLQAQADKEAVEAPTMAEPAALFGMGGRQAEAAIASGAARPVGDLDESDDKVIEEAVEPEAMVEIDNDGNVTPVSGATGQAQEKPTESAKLWSPGMPVRVLHEDELKKGRIVGVPNKQTGAAVKLTVEVEGGGTVTVNEDEVEAD